MSQASERQSFAADVERTYRHQLPQATAGDSAWMACLNAVVGLAIFASTSRRPHEPSPNKAGQSVDCESVGCEGIDGGSEGAVRPVSIARSFATGSLRHTTPPAVGSSGRKRPRAELDGGEDEGEDCPRPSAQRS